MSPDPADKHTERGMRSKSLGLTRWDFLKTRLSDKTVKVLLIILANRPIGFLKLKYYDNN